VFESKVFTLSSIKLAPSILSADFTRLGADLSACQAAGADWIHVDVMDGRFVPNITMGSLIVEAARRATTLPLDVHLMILEPERYIDAFAKAGASHITVHVETSPHLHRTLQAIRALGVKAGIAVNPHTPVSSFSDVLYLADIVTVMTVNPGFGGQSLIRSTLAKFTQLRQLATESGQSLDLVADGGVNTHTAADVAAAGASVLVAGNAVFAHPNGIAGGIADLRGALKGAF
jgi:ribulose-phosphate 3-epimerase